MGYKNIRKLYFCNFHQKLLRDNEGIVYTVRKIWNLCQQNFVIRVINVTKIFKRFIFATFYENIHMLKTLVKRQWENVVYIYIYIYIEGKFEECVRKILQYVYYIHVLLMSYKNIWKLYFRNFHQKLLRDNEAIVYSTKEIWSL